MPLDLYLLGAGATVAVSFVVMAVLSRAGADERRGGRRLIARGLAGGSGPAAAALGVGALGALGVAALATVLWSGFLGVQSPLRNFAPTMVWVVWWVGMAYVCALLGDLWSLVDPWSALARAGGRALPRKRPLLTYPRRLGAWPAALTLLAYAWLELVWDGAERPAALATLVSAYSAWTLLGMWVFGRRAWRRHAEGFSVLFTTLARFAPLAAGRGRLWLRPPASDLLRRPAPSAAMTAFVLLMLAIVTYDGFKETPAWQGLLDLVAASDALRAPLVALQRAGVDLLALVETVGLLAFGLGFAALFSTTVALMVAAAGWPRSRVRTLPRLSGCFVLTLVPIAIAYHLSHYLSYLLIAGQLIIPLASDPLGRGWDLLGTADYRIDVAIVNARFVWYTALGAIVGGHVIAVYLAHRIARRLYETRARALRSQVPMLVLMVGYTMSSLWILSQPIVSG